MTEKNVVTAIHDALHDEMAADERVVVLGEDIGVRGGVFRVTQGFLEEFGEQRVIGSRSLACWTSSRDRYDRSSSSEVCGKNR